MPKAKQRQQKPSKANPGRARPPKRRMAAAAKRAKAAQRPSPSQTSRLVAEVERLEQELGAARAQMAALEACAEIDPLTNIANRRGFERELKRACAYVKRYAAGAALIYVDLDNFKRVNDQHGHAAGDAVLKAIATVLTRHVRASDLAARVGGDEFALLLWQCTEAGAQTKAVALEDAIARTSIIYEGPWLSVDASAGAAML